MYTPMGSSTKAPSSLRRNENKKGKNKMQHPILREINYRRHEIQNANKIQNPTTQKGPSEKGASICNAGISTDS